MKFIKFGIHDLKTHIVCKKEFMFLRSSYLVLFFSILPILFSSSQSWSQSLSYDPSAEKAPLSPPFTHLVPPQIFPTTDHLTKRASSKIHKTISFQSPVKSQGNRGVCSIFSTLSLLEAHYTKLNAPNLSSYLDLSEEWASYLAHRYKTEEGSNAYTNIREINHHGMVSENVWIYDPNLWEKDSLSPKAIRHCGQYNQERPRVEQQHFLSCLVSHRSPKLLELEDDLLINNNHPFYDPEFASIKKHARNFLNNNPLPLKLVSLDSNKKIRQSLQQNKSVILEMDFYYGAWNHRKADEYGIGRQMDLWYQGIVGYPEEDSLDYEKSPEHPAGHSFVVVGYDDNKIVETNIQMKDGSFKRFQYKGVYYFKNSWGQENFGKDFHLDHKKYPGYGMITYQYAHQYGSFFRLLEPDEVTDSR
jgi:C1A family cysteine protease